MFGAGVRLEDGIETRGADLVFPPRSAFAWVPIDAAAGTYRLEIAVEGCGGLRAEIVTANGPYALPLQTAAAGTFTVSFALRDRVGWLRLAPVEAGAVRFTGFALVPRPAWRSLLPDWRFGPLSLPFSQIAAAPAAPPSPPPEGWDARIAVDGLANLSLDGNLADCDRGGAIRLALSPPLSPGAYLVTADFRDDQGAPALVAPRLYADGAPPNALPAAHFRHRIGARYAARLMLGSPATHLVLLPRQERGRVRIDRLRVRRVGPLFRVWTLAQAGWRAFAPRVFAPLERLVGGDPERDGGVAAHLRLLTLADLRHRAALRRYGARQIRDWLARPVLREGVLGVFVGPGPAAARERTLASVAAGSDAAYRPVQSAAEADLVLDAGAIALPHALAAIRRVPPGPPPAYATDRIVLGLRSAPAFGNPAGGATATVPLVLAHRPRRRVAAPAGGPRAAATPRSPAPTISIVTATKDAPQHLTRFLQTLRPAGGDGAELILIDNASSDPAALDLLERARTMPGVRVVRDDRAFNFAAMSNLGASLASGEILVFANNDIEFRYPGWAEALAGALEAPGVGVAGALLDYPDGRVQHAGIVLAGEARVRHLERFSPAADVGYFGRRRGITAVTAVTGALMAVRRDDFRRLGGFAAARYPVLYNDVDFCLRAQAAGLGVVLACDARAVHHESATFGRRRSEHVRARGGPLWRLERAEEADRFRQDWARQLDADPCYPGACDPVEAAFRARL